MPEYFRIATDDTGKRRLGPVGPQPEVARRDAAFGSDCGRLDEQQACAGQRQMAEMDQVPVASFAIDCGILAHRRDRDPVAQNQIAKCDSGKQFAHGE